MIDKKYLAGAAVLLGIGVLAAANVFSGLNFGSETCEPQLLKANIGGENVTFSSIDEAQRSLGIPEEETGNLKMKDGEVWINPECGVGSEVNS